MDPIEAEYESSEDIPEAYRDLYEERGGKFLLTRVNGLVTTADLDRVRRAHRQEKTAHGETRNQLKPWEAFGSPEDLQAKLDRIEELEAAAAGNIDEEKMTQLVEARTKSALAPVIRERDKLLSEHQDALATISKYQEKETRSKIVGDLRAAAKQAKVTESAMADLEMYASKFQVDDLGNTTTRDDDMLDPAAWIAKMAPDRPHWFGTSVGGGGRGGSASTHGGNNPWSAAHWNLTKQSQYQSEHGEAKAKKMCQAAGATWGSIRPPSK